MADDVRALIERLEVRSIIASEASRMLAEVKSRRQGDGSRSDLYMWLRPEQTLEARAATALRELLAEVERKTAVICAICEARDDENPEALIQAISDAQTEVIVSALETNNDG